MLFLLFIYYTPSAQKLPPLCPILVYHFILMKDSPLMQKSKAFALEVIKVCKALREAKCEGALVNQFLRSGTSIGANIWEA